MPLAERMRPRTLEELMGQGHLVGEGKLLRRAIAEDRIPSLLLWGPPGVGKTTLARVIAERTKSHFVPFSAVLGGLPELRVIVAEAKERRAYRGERTLVFVDEIHRFNKAQQDAFLPHVEDGSITLVGATTENPSFAVNAALLSRCKVFRLDRLGEDDLERLLHRALTDPDRGLGAVPGGPLTADEGVLRTVAALAQGDGRRALNMLEAVANYVLTGPGGAEAVRGAGGARSITADALAAVHERAPLLYDKAGDEHYGVVSAFIKSMRGSDPDAALYWAFRMLEAGDDPLFVLRRMLIFASEDIGNADPRALVVVQAADQAFRRMGMPEGAYPIAHAVLYLAVAPKSDGVKKALGRVKALIGERGSLPVPKKLRNAPTALMRAEGYGADYKYAHDYEDGVVPGETYLPDELTGTILYEPTDRGEEARIRARLQSLRAAKPPVQG